MALQDILQKILEEAESEIKALDEALVEEKKQLHVEAEKEAALALNSIAQKKADALASVEKKTNAIARRDVKTVIQQARRSVISSAMEQFHDHLVSLPDAQYQAVLEKLIAPLSGEGVLFVPKARMELTKKLAPKNFTVEVSDAVAGGFLAKLPKAEVDCSFHSLVFSEFRNEIESFFAQKLNLI
jgi:vacuolar-type H+-ATPase subunit E/Vma4